MDPRRKSTRSQTRQKLKSQSKAQLDASPSSDIELPSGYGPKIVASSTLSQSAVFTSTKLGIERIFFGGELRNHLTTKILCCEKATVAEGTKQLSDAAAEVREFENNDAKKKRERTIISNVTFTLSMYNKFDTQWVSPPTTQEQGREQAQEQKQQQQQPQQQQEQEEDQETRKIPLVILTCAEGIVLSADKGTTHLKNCVPTLDYIDGCDYVYNEKKIQIKNKKSRAAEEKRKERLIREVKFRKKALVEVGIINADDVIKAISDYFRIIVNTTRRHGCAKGFIQDFWHYKNKEDEDDKANKNNNNKNTNKNKNKGKNKNKNNKNKPKIENENENKTAGVEIQQLLEPVSLNIIHNDYDFGKTYSNFEGAVRDCYFSEINERFGKFVSQSTIHKMLHNYFILSNKFEIKKAELEKEFPEAVQYISDNWENDSKIWKPTTDTIPGIGYNSDGNDTSMDDEFKEKITKSKIKSKTKAKSKLESKLALKSKLKRKSKSKPNSNSNSNPNPNPRKQLLLRSKSTNQTQLNFEPKIHVCVSFICLFFFLFYFCCGSRFAFLLIILARTGM